MIIIHKYKIHSVYYIYKKKTVSDIQFNERFMLENSVLMSKQPQSTKIKKTRVICLSVVDSDTGEKESVCVCSVVWIQTQR